MNNGVMNKYQSVEIQSVEIKTVVTTVAKILNIDKVSWARAIKACKQAMQDGFTLDDFIIATENMKEVDQKYWSIYSIFQKTDYWLRMKPPKKVWRKGIW